MHDFKPGQVYISKNTNQRREILFVTDQNVMTRNVDSGIETLWGKKDFPDMWVLLPPVKKLYVSVWKNISGHTWAVSYPDKQTYDKLISSYNRDNYTLLKEYTLEYEDSNEVR